MLNSLFSHKWFIKGKYFEVLWVYLTSWIIYHQNNEQFMTFGKSVYRMTHTMVTCIDTNLFINNKVKTKHIW